jgi:hypothetical protein
MVEECIHVNEAGHKCRRIPKRGQKLCPAHRKNGRQRRLLEEDDAFLLQMFAYVDQLKAMNLEDLLYATGGALADIHSLIDRRSSRRDRAAFTRATVAVTSASDRLAENMAAFRAHSHTVSPAQPATPFALPPSAKPAAASKLSPTQIDALCDKVLSILEPNASTASTLNTNT